jgi:photosystem II stability/assembly factor-like uncharacterized protein
MSYFKSILFLFGITILIFGCKSKTENPSTNNTTEITPDSVTSAFQTSPSPGVVLMSADMGKTWQPMSEGLPTELSAAGIEQMGGELILATKKDGLFISKNNGREWKDNSSGLATKKINTLYISGDELYLGLSHEGVTMWKLNSSFWNSYNAGLPNRNVLSIVKVKDELIIGTDTGIFKSKGHLDGWNGKNIGEQAVSLQSKGDTIFAGTINGVMISKDGGEKWSYVRKSGRIHSLTLIDHFLYAQFASGEVYRTDNWGGNWDKINFGAEDHTPVYAIIKGKDQYLLSHRTGIFASSNGRSGWKLIYPTSSYWFTDMVMKEEVLYATTDRQ